MSLGAHITQEIKTIILDIHLKHPEFGPKKLQEELLIQMKQRPLYGIYDANWPGISAVGKALQEMRKKEETRTPELKGLDKPWSTGTLDKYPIPSEALPYVLKAWVYYQEVILEPPAYDTRPFSVRIAKWVARLYRIYENAEIAYLTNMACRYAIDEQAAELINTDFVKVNFDLELYEKVTGEKVLDNEERFRKITRGLDLPEDYIEWRRSHFGKQEKQ